ncbi:MAG TPA: PKD domain-containing protein, partial [Thermoanaerobaculia bacterium]|nr:PKD domain-containing protein [Thermoanaerobaculia bacterium]
EGDLPLTVSFVGNDSSDPDTDPLTFSWDFGDGAVSTHPDPVHTFETAGAWTVTLVVRDPSGEEGRSSITILAGNTAPEPEILAPAEGTLYAIGDVLELSGRAFDHQDGELPGEHLRWSAMLHHNDHVHPDFFAATGGSASLTPEDHGDQTWLELELEATDSEGARAVVTRELRPREVALSFRTEPEGLEILYDSTQRPTPFTITTITGSERLVVAPPVQNHRSFARWLDSAERVRRLRVGESDASYVAIYENQPPQAVITVVSANRDPLAVELTATESTDPEGGPLEYEWDPGDGSPLKTGPSFTHVYAGPGAPRVRLVVRDALGAEGTAWLDLSNRRRPVRR